MTKKLTTIRKIPIEERAPPKIEIRIDPELSGDGIDVIIIDTPSGRFHVAGAVEIFTKRLLRIDEVLVYGLDGLDAGCLGHGLIFRIGRAAMEILDVDQITVSGWRSSGARPGRKSRDVIFRRQTGERIPSTHR